MLRNIYRKLLMVISAIETIPAMIKIKLFKHKYNEEQLQKKIFKVTKRFGNRVMKSTGATINIAGLENIPAEPNLFVSNHEGNYDIPLLFHAVPRKIGFVAKIELKKVPVASFWIEAMGGVFMDRDNKRQSGQSLIKSAENLRKGHSQVIFPEGTRSKSGNVNPFQSVSLRIAQKADSPIVPVAIDGTYKISNNEKKPTINITFLNPIRVAKGDNLELVAENIRQSIIDVNTSKQYIKK